MSGTPSRISFLLLLCAMAFWGCDESEEILPDPPSGTSVIGTKMQEVGTAIHALPGGGFVAASAAQDEENSWSVSLMELNEDGQLMREEVLTHDGYDDVVRSIKPATAGGYLMAGIGRDVNKNFTGFILLTDDNLLEQRLLRFPVDVPGSYYGGEEASYAEAFEMVGGGWSLFVRQRGTAMCLRVSDQGGVSAQRVLGFAGSRGSVSGRELGQDAAGNLYHLEAYYNYPNLSVQLSLLDQASLFPTQTYNLNLDTLNTDNYNVVSTGALKARPNGNLVGSIVIQQQANLVFEITPSGTVLWSRNLNIPEDLFLMQIADDGGVRLGGQTSTANYYGAPAPNRNLILVSLDSLGGSMRRRVFGGDNPESIGGIAIGLDGRTQAIGATSSYGNGQSDVFLFSYN